MMKASKIIHLNSNNRVSGAHENASYKIDISPSEKYNYCCVLACSIPVSYYLIQSPYNTMNLKESATTVTITIPEGNYNINSFGSTVAALLTAGSPTGYTYTITTNNSFTTVNNGKYTYTVSGNGGVQPEFIFTTNVNEQFGFDPNTTKTFSGNTITSSNVVNFIPEQSLFLYSNLINNTSNNTLNVLQEIYGGNTPSYGMINYQCTSVEGYSRKINEGHTTGFTITLCNENNRILNLNGRNILITLLLYNKDNIYEIARNYLKYNLLNENV